MLIFGHDISFWFASLGAAALKIALAPWEGHVKGIISFAIAIFIGIVFTDPVIAYLNLDPEVYKNAVAALVTLTGEGLARWFLQYAMEPAKLIEFIKGFRRGGKE